MLLYRFRRRSRRLTLGRYPALSLAEARGEARKALALLASGVDPRGANEPERNPEVFATLVDEFVETHCKRHNRATTAVGTERILRVHFMPSWSKRDLSDIRKADVLRIIDGIVNRNTPSAANHAFVAIRTFFNWCIGRGYLELSPCQGMTMPTKLVSRDRVLTDQELTSIWKAGNAIGYPFAAVLQLLILTAQRRGEVASMQWENFDLAGRTWSIPADVAKSGRSHVVPLCSFSTNILLTLPKLEEKWIFPARSKTNQHYRNFTFAKARVDEISGITNWTLHDLRRTAATGMAKLGTPPHVVERILNHRTGSLGGVAGVDNRFGYLTEMRTALEQWSQFVNSLISHGDDHSR